jgi:hypothetical protein
MSNPSDQGPMAPRRTLSKPASSPDNADTNPTSKAAGASNGKTGSATQRSAATGTKQASSKPKAKPPRKGKSASSEPSGPAQTAGPVSGPPSNSPSGGPNGGGRPQDRQPDQVSFGANGGSLPTYVPGGGNATTYSSVDVPTEHHMPVVPPMAPTPTAAPDPDQQRKQQEKAEKAAARAAAKAARKAEASKPRTVRRAKLRLTRVDPWSVTKTAFLLSIAFGVMCVVAVFLVFSIMDAAGLWDSVNNTIQDVVNQSPEDRFDINDYVAMSRVMGITMLISAIDVVIITALATLGAFLYNMSASLLGGVEVTLAEDVR